MNERQTLTKDEEESLAYLQACGVPLVKDCICEEALVNVGLSLAEPQGKMGVVGFFYSSKLCLC